MAAKKIDRKRLLKEPDEFLTTTARMIQWAQRNSRQVVVGVVAALVVLAIAVAVGTYTARQERKAAAELAATVDAWNKASAEQPAAKALKEVEDRFKQLVERYGGRQAGKLGRMRYAAALLQAGRFDEAITQYRLALDALDDTAGLQPLLLCGLAQALEAKGQAQQAAEALQQVVDRPGSLMKDVALFHLGRLLEQQGKTTEAQAMFKRLADEFADSPLARLVITASAG